MNGRKLAVLTAIAGVLALGEVGSAVMIWLEKYPDSMPLGAVVFAGLFLVGAWLLRSRRVTAGSVVVGLLCLFEVVSFSGWTRPQRLGLDLPDQPRCRFAGRVDRRHRGARRPHPPPGRGLTRQLCTAMLAGGAGPVHHRPMQRPELVQSLPAAPVRSRVTAAAACAAVVVALAGGATATAYDRAGAAVFADALSFALAIAAVAVVGAVVTLAAPSNRVGWLLLAGAAVMGAGEAFTEAGVHGVVTAPGSVPAAGYLAAVGPGLEAAGMLIVVVGVPVVFPDGRLPGPRWRWLAWCAVAAVACLLLGNVLSPYAQQDRLAHWQSPLGLPGRYADIADGLSAAGVLLAAGAAAGAVAGLITRWRRGGPLVRQQLLLLALAACPPALVFVAVILTGSLPGWIFGVVLVPLPIAIAVATLSHGLYDLRRAAHHTLLWLTMSATVIGVYAVVVAAAASLVPGQHAWWPPALAAAAAALLLVPLRETVQRAVNRVVYGRWHEPYEVLAGLGERLEAAANVDRLLDAAVTELTAGLDLREVSVRGLDGAAVAGAAEAASASTSIPLQAYGATVGCLTYRAPDRQLSAAEQRLVRDLARQLGGALHARLLRQDLQRARERLVLAREEERRRLRRDLHDGIGPALAGLTLKTETAKALLPSGADAAARQLQGLSEEIRRTVVDVRRLVEGLRPPALDELGLVGACVQAIERLTATADLAASVQASDDLPALPAAVEVEVAAYRIVVEAVTNIVRHARARACQVSLAFASTELVLTIADDGAGLDTAGQPGSGLAIMRERAEELGGAVTLSDAAPGVVVNARLPVVPAPAQVSRVPAGPP
jgi:signal transduction histidine kinase